MKRGSVVAALVLFCTAACSQQAPQPQFTAEDEAAIRTLFDQWEANLSGGNVMANLNYYADDAVELLRRPRVGSDEIRTRWEGFVDRYEYTASNTRLRELLGFGDYAFAWVEWEDRYRYDGAPRISNGTMSVLLQRDDDGASKIFRTSWMSAAADDTTAMATASGANQ